MRFLLLFIGLNLIILTACQHDNPQRHYPQDSTAKQVTPSVENEEAKPIYKTIKYPCADWKPVEAAYKSEATNGFRVKIVSICENDYAVVDTSEGLNDTLYIRQSSNYKNKITMLLPNDSVEYFIYKKDVAALGDVSKCVLTNPSVLEPEYSAFNQSDTSIRIDLLLGVPDTDDVIICKFKIYYNRGVKYLGYEDIFDADDQIYDANAN